MTKCERVRSEDEVERYLLDRLPERDRDAFELHYFDCPVCFEEVQTFRATQAELVRQASDIRSEPSRAIRWKWTLAAASAVLALVLGLILTRPPAQPVVDPPPSLSILTRVDPPTYTPRTQRSPVDDARRRFQDAMDLYVNGEFASALPSLRAASELAPRAPDIRFFLGVSYLLSGRTEMALDELEETIRLGDTPFLERARFYRAKALLREGQVQEARGELQRVIELQGKLEPKARQLLHELSRLAEGEALADPARGVEP